MSKHYLTYRHLLKTQSKLTERAPLELTMLCFGVDGDDRVEVDKEVADNYGEWIITK